ncbi:DNA gyrase inhibitor YacG [Salinarimonas soli]|uniref:DNA gyrase inhibitor YacG n=1 Tax=Salinarimonas soli TaxID=1638099 RepID=A0A5B2V9R2_9HYPH|nr:DNA gyrase inhibitor YacG [Salinarimonas soli]KAA2236233.1 DNA gyrase inhibitor YacG [Salinarimonas soli]
MSETPFVPRPCPICSKPSTEAARPFCSTRCANVDLQHWLTGAYALPAEEEDNIDEEGDGDGA